MQLITVAQNIPTVFFSFMLHLPSRYTILVLLKKNEVLHQSDSISNSSPYVCGVDGGIFFSLKKMDSLGTIHVYILTQLYILLFLYKSNKSTLQFELLFIYLFWTRIFYMLDTCCLFILFPSKSFCPHLLSFTACCLYSPSHLMPFFASSITMPWLHSLEMPHSSPFSKGSTVHPGLSIYLF